MVQNGARRCVFPVMLIRLLTQSVRERNLPPPIGPIFDHEKYNSDHARGHGHAEGHEAGHP